MTEVERLQLKIDILEEIQPYLPMPSELNQRLRELKADLEIAEEDENFQDKLLTETVHDSL